MELSHTQSPIDFFGFTYHLQFVKGYTTYQVSWKAIMANLVFSSRKTTIFFTISTRAGTDLWLEYLISFPWLLQHLSFWWPQSDLHFYERPRNWKQFTDLILVHAIKHFSFKCHFFWFMGMSTSNFKLWKYNNLQDLIVNNMASNLELADSKP